MAVAELSGVLVVGAGAFNPAVFHPRWLADRQLIPEDAANSAMRRGGSVELIVSSQITVFVADWLHVQVTPEQAIFSTVDLGRELDLRDFAAGIFDLAPETPVNALGINSDTHFRVGSEEAWHQFGDRFLPKDFWEPLFDQDGWRTRPDGHRVGMRVMTVEIHRGDVELPGYVRVELAPSARIVPNGVYIGINAHFLLTTSDAKRGTAGQAALVLRDNWETTRSLEGRLIEHVLEAV